MFWVKTAVLLIGMLTAAPALAAASEVGGAWNVGCGLVGSGQYDAIRAPGQPGASHLHDFFGFRNFRSSLSAAEVGGAEANSCLLKSDNSAYWTPALYQNGLKVNPSAIWAYYLSPQGAGKISAYPLGMKILGGDAYASKPQYQAVRWYCDWDSTFSGPPQRPPPCGGILPVDQPDGSSMQDQLRLQITFPDCWNGQLELGSVRYAKQGKCPAGHGRRLPQLQLNVLYPVQYPGDNLSLASGSIITAHADFVNGCPALS